MSSKGKKDLKKATKNDNDADTEKDKSEETKTKSSDVRIEIPSVNTESGSVNPGLTPDPATTHVTTPRVNDGNFASKIVTQIQSAYQGDIESSLEGRKSCHKTASSFMTLEKILLAISTILVFVTASDLVGDSSKIISFVAGGLIVVAEAIAGFQVYAKKASQTKTKELNELLANSGLEFVMPDLTDDHYDVVPTNRKIPLGDVSTSVTDEKTESVNGVNRHTATI